VDLLLLGASRLGVDRRRGGGRRGEGRRRRAWEEGVSVLKVEARRMFWAELWMLLEEVV
jgi:hypothetical protein